jgi:hypothetical protein
VFAAPIIGGMWFFTLRQLAVAASWSGGSIFSLQTFLMQVAAPTPQTSGRLTTVCPNMPELLAVVALCKTILSPVGLHPDCYVKRAVRQKISCDLAVLGKVIRKRGRFLGRDLSDGDFWVLVICLTLIMSKPRSVSPSEMSWAGVFKGRWQITALIGFSVLWKKVK